MNLAKRYWDDPSLPFLKRVDKIPMSSHKEQMIQLYEMGYHDFDQLYDLVEADMSGNLDEILSQLS